MSRQDEFFIKEGATSPSLIRALYDGEGVVLPVAEAHAVYFSMGRGALTVFYRRPCIVLETGAVQYDWQPGDTDESELFEGQFDIEWTPGVFQGVPANGFLNIGIGRSVRPLSPKTLT